MIFGHAGIACKATIIGCKATIKQARTVTQRPPYGRREATPVNVA